MQGDFEAFYLRHFKAIYRVCYAFMKNAADAEDCTEDAFVKAMSCDISFENERHERSWLTTTAMNICKSAFPNLTQQFPKNARQSNLLDFPSNNLYS